MKLIGREASRPRINAIVATGIAVVAGMLAASQPQYAEAAPFKIYSPRVVKGEMKSSTVVFTISIKTMPSPAGKSRSSQ